MQAASGTGEQARVASSGFRIRAVLLPSIAEVALAAVLCWLFFGAVGARTLLGDGDTGWHIRTGEYVLDNGALPPTDPFSFTMEGREWFAWEWLADVALALAFRLDGLQGVALLGGAMIGLSTLLVLRFLLWRGANVFLAIFAMLAISSVTSSHWLARPHMFTWVFFIATLWLLEADRRRNSWRVWLLAPLVALWVNVHGGFMAALLTTGAFGFGVGVEQLLEARHAKGDRFHWFIPPGWLRYAGVFFACAAATLINPYGYHLHEHVIAYLQSDFILNAVQEFQAPKFRNEAERVFEITLLAGLVVGGVMMRRREIAWPLVVLAWAHATLTSFRHGALFMLAAAPVIAFELSRWIEAGARAGNQWLKTLQQVADDYSPSRAQAGSSSASFPLTWLTPVALLFLAYSMNERAADDWRWRAEFPAERFPVRAADALGERLLEGRLLTSDQWGDYLVFRYYPRYKTFIDGRSDFYDPAVRDDYVRLLGSEFDWRTVIARYEFDAILAPLDWTLTAALKQDESWRLVYDDGFALYFVPADPAPAVDARAALELGPQLPGDPLRAP